jgi:hypothetical protein
MIVDYLRSCYTATVRWQQGGAATARIRWLPAKPGAKIFPYRTAFCSSVWQPDFYPNLGVGEIDRYRTWSPNVPSVLAGDHFDGPAEWFLTGVPADHWADPPVNCGLVAAIITPACSLGMTVQLQPLEVTGVRPACSLGMTVQLQPLEVTGVRPACSLGITVHLQPLEVTGVRPACSLGMTVQLQPLEVTGVRPACSLGITCSCFVEAVTMVLADCSLGVTTSVLTI